MFARVLRSVALLGGVLCGAWLVLSCGAEITVLGAPGVDTGGGTATGSVGGSGVGGTTTGVGGTGATGAGATGGGPSGICGGDSGQTCSLSEFCDWPDDSCGEDGTPGHCMPRPDGCDDDCPGVCGCDGLFYCNECNAHETGLDVSTSVDCTADSSEYSARWNSSNSSYQLWIWKADPVRDICIRIHTRSDLPDTQDAPGFDFTMPPHYSISAAVVTSPAEHCGTPNSWPEPMYQHAVSGVGVVDWELNWCPTEIDIQAVIYFDADEPWIPAVEVLSASGVPVDDCDLP